MGKKWAQKNSAYLFFEEDGRQKNKKRWAKNGLLEFKIYIPQKVKDKMAKGQNLARLSPFGIPKKKKRWAVDGQCAHQIKMKKMGIPKNKKRWGNAHFF